MSALDLGLNKNAKLVFAKILYEKCTLQYFSALYYHSMPIVAQFVHKCLTSQIYFAVFQYFNLFLLLPQALTKDKPLTILIPQCIFYNMFRLAP